MKHTIVPYRVICILNTHILVAAQAGGKSEYPQVSNEMQTCIRGSMPKQFSQLVFTCIGEWRSRSVSTLCDMRKPVVSCPQERYVSVFLKAIVSIFCVSGFRAEFWSFDY